MFPRILKLNRMRLFMIFKYHLLMYLPGQQSSGPANLTEPELPVTIPKCPAIHFHFLASLASHCTFSDLLLERFLFVLFILHSNNGKKTVTGCWFQPQRGVAAAASLLGLFGWCTEERVWVLYLMLSPDTNMAFPDPAAPERESAVTWTDAPPQHCSLVSAAGISSIPTFFSPTLDSALLDR